MCACVLQYVQLYMWHNTHCMSVCGFVTKCNSLPMIPYHYTVGEDCSDVCCCGWPYPYSGSSGQGWGSFEY